MSGLLKTTCPYNGVAVRSTKPVKALETTLKGINLYFLKRGKF